MYNTFILFVSLNSNLNPSLFRFVAFKYRVNTTVVAIAEKTGHSRETVAARIKTGEVNFATSQVVHASTAAKS